MGLRELLLLICLLGGIAGTIAATMRRDIGGAMLPLLVVAVSVYGLLI